MRLCTRDNTALLHCVAVDSRRHPRRHLVQAVVARVGRWIPRGVHVTAVPGLNVLLKTIFKALLRDSHLGGGCVTLAPRDCRADVGSASSSSNLAGTGRF